jgi:hypothetical protein
MVLIEDVNGRNGQIVLVLIREFAAHLSRLLTLRNWFRYAGLVVDLSKQRFHLHKDARENEIGKEKALGVFQTQNMVIDVGQPQLQRQTCTSNDSRDLRHRHELAQPLQVESVASSQSSHDNVGQAIVVW